MCIDTYVQLGCYHNDRESNGKERGTCNVKWGYIVAWFVDSGSQNQGPLVEILRGLYWGHRDNVIVPISQVSAIGVLTNSVLKPKS